MLVSPGVVLLANFVVGAACLRLRPMAASGACCHATLWLSWPSPPFRSDRLSAHRLRLWRAATPGNNISRWDAYRSPGGALGWTFVLSVALMAVCAAVLFYAGLRGRDGLLRVTAFLWWTGLAGSPDGDDFRFQRELGSRLTCTR